ncbi:MAG TPA: acetyl-CoA acetyltransferase [Acidimicrobiales bacterium]|nr:acetyl-CoA acetyltransferase [Acidimicrobiales bacterium]
MSAAAKAKRRAVIVGVATSDYPKLPHMSEHAVHGQAADRALADAGLTLTDVDGFGTTGFFPMYAVGVAEYFGVHPTYLDETNAGGASFEVLVEHAAYAIESGAAEVVLITYGSIQLSQMGRRLGTGGGGGAGFAPGPAIYDALWGNTLVGNYAMAARRHMHQFGTTAEQLASVAVTMRKHAGSNPQAQEREPITVEDVVSSRLVADPLHKLDCCVISDGGGACVLTTAERAADLDVTPIHLLGAAHATTHHMNLSAMDDLTVTPAAQCGPVAFGRAGIRPEDVDVAELYDSFTITVVLTVEDLGFCKKGEGGSFVDDGGLGVGGNLPTNTDGGGLSACHPGMRGMFLIVEAVRQLRGEGGATQVPDAKIAVAHGTGGMLSTGATLVLSREAP